MDLVDALRRPEGKTLEFKRDLSSPDGVLKTLVAFANTAGGTLLIGVEDATRHVRGVNDPLDLEERLASLVSDSIIPRLIPELEILPWRRTQLLAVQAHPSPSRPHYLKREGRESGVYVRVGSTNRRADAELIEELRRYARGEAFDEQPMPDLDSEALDFRAASESFAPVRKLARKDLETLRLVTHPPGAQGADGRRHAAVRPRALALFSRRLDPGRPFRRNGQDPHRRPARDPCLPGAGDRGRDRVRPEARAARSRDRRGASQRTLEPAAGGGARGDRQRGGARGLRAARRADAAVDLRRPARSREPGAAAFRPDGRRPA